MPRPATDPFDVIGQFNLSTLPLEERLRVKQLLERKALIRGIPRRAQAWPEDIEAYLKEVAPHIVQGAMAPHHFEFWDYLKQVVPGFRPDPLAFFVTRGGAKSASAEMAAVLLGGLNRRRYFGYVCGTQELADDHVTSISALLESQALANKFPLMADRKIGKFGPKSWRRNRLWTAAGVVIDAIGLDVSTRGRRLEEQRPDCLVFDDFDDVNDGPGVVIKKRQTITGTMLPMGSRDLFTMFVQNLIHENSIARRIAYPLQFKEEERLLLRRHMIGPIPALIGLAMEQVAKEDGTPEYIITAGTPTWDYLDRKMCEAALNEVGPLAFKREYQHDTTPPPGGVFSHVTFRHMEPKDIPWKKMVDGVVAVDPSTTSTDMSDSVGISASCVDDDGYVYRLWNFERVVSPSEALEIAILKCYELGFSTVVVEDNQGGDTWKDVFKRALDKLRTPPEDKPPGTNGKLPMFDKQGVLLRTPWQPRLVFVRVGGQMTKIKRAESMEPDYARGDIIHVTGTHEIAEVALYRFPLTKPHDLVDALVHSWKFLRRIRKSPNIQSTGPDTKPKSAWVTPGSANVSTGAGAWSLEGAGARDGAFSWRMGN